MRSVILLFSRLFARPRRHNRVILIFNRMVDAIHLKFWSFTLAVLGNRARARPIQWRGCRIPAKLTAGDRTFSSNTANKISLSPFLRFFSFIHCPIFSSPHRIRAGQPTLRFQLRYVIRSSAKTARLCFHSYCSCYSP